MGDSESGGRSGSTSINDDNVNGAKIETPAAAAAVRHCGTKIGIKEEGAKGAEGCMDSKTAEAATAAMRAESDLETRKAEMSKTVNAKISAEDDHAVMVGPLAHWRASPPFLLRTAKPLLLVKHEKGRRRKRGEDEKIGLRGTGRVYQRSGLEFRIDWPRSYQLQYIPGTSEAFFRSKKKRKIRAEGIKKKSTITASFQKKWDEFIKEGESQNNTNSVGRQGSNMEIVEC